MSTQPGDEGVSYRRISQVAERLRHDMDELRRSAQTIGLQELPEIIDNLSRLVQAAGVNPLLRNLP